MLYTELLRLWDEAVKAVDARDWQGALSKLDEITEPTSRTLFITASCHLALGQPVPAIKALEQTIVKDERLAVAFFQRSGAYLLANRCQEALNDCISAQKHLRENVVIDYRQLGLRYKLYCWQVLYNAAAAHSRMAHWEKARNIVVSASQERGGGKAHIIEMALDKISRREEIAPLFVPAGDVFRPRKQDIEQLQERDFLGKPKVIVSKIPNDDFGGFEPLRMQKPGYYEPKMEGTQDSRYMRLTSPHMSRGPNELTVPQGALVFIYTEVDEKGLVTVIHDGQKGLVPMTLLEPVDTKKRPSIPSGIPLPPGLLPPTRPDPPPGMASPMSTPRAIHTPPPTYASATLKTAEPPMYTPPTSHTPNSSTKQDPGRKKKDDLDTVVEQDPGWEQKDDVATMLVKVHYRYTVALKVPLDTPHHELQKRIAHKLGQPASHLRLRHRQHGSQVLRPLDAGVELQTLLDEGDRTTLWCQTEDPLANRTILYQMVALYDYGGEGAEDLEFSEGDTIDILSEVNEEWLEGHCSGHIGIFPSCFACRDGEIHKVDVDI